MTFQMQNNMGYFSGVVNTAYGVQEDACFWFSTAFFVKLAFMALMCELGISNVDTRAATAQYEMRR